MATEGKLVDAVCQLVNDPLGYVYFAFPWRHEGTSLEHEDGPDDWQIDVLQDLGKGLVSAKEAIQLAVSSGHGVGKTALVAWIILWFLSTHPHPQAVITANTEKQLSTKTWRELAKWKKLAINGHWFKWTATKFYLSSHPETWYATAVPWSQEKSEAFSGTHERHVLMIFDEASAIDDIIWETAEGAMTTPTEMGHTIWLAFGNPTRNTGRFKECFPGGKFAKFWQTKRVDGRAAKMTDKAKIAQWIEAYGEDSDFVRVRVKGIHPRAASNQFIGEDLVEEAQGREIAIAVYDHMPILVGVDPARFGDDKSVIYIRQGLKTLEVNKYAEIDLMTLAAHVSKKIDEFNPTATFIDEAGFGAGVIDRLRQLNYRVVGVNGASNATEDEDFYNHRTEMWADMKDWLKRGNIPADPELKADLVGPEYGFDSKNRVQLERKEHMKDRGLPSPDIADALALTFSYRVRTDEDRARGKEFKSDFEFDVFTYDRTEV